MSLFFRRQRGCRCRVDFAERLHVARAHAGYGEQRFVARGLDRLQAAEMTEEQLARVRAETCDVVERGLEALLLAEALAGAVREAMRLVSRAGEEEHRGRVALQRDRVL